jgi:hypothetical protein
MAQPTHYGWECYRDFGLGSGQIGFPVLVVIRHRNGVLAFDPGRAAEVFLQASDEPIRRSGGWALRCGRFRL